MTTRFRRIAVAGLAATVVTAVSAGAVVIQTQGVRITALAQVMPYKLPREGTAPVAVFVAGHLENPDGGVPPQLQRMRIRVNRHGLLQSRGLPVCPVGRIVAISTQSALAACKSALIGSGQFWANIVFDGQPPYPTQGRLLIFNGRQDGKPAVLAQIFTKIPFNSSFVIAFRLRKIDKGPYGTELSASLPQALGSWGYLNRIKLTLRRQYTYKGKRLSYFNAGCPAPGGAKRTAFPLAHVSFSFAGKKEIGAAVTKSCGVKE
ncbi:MAG TPA: hypothetical protein VNM38_07160 [Solirubrobacterales bacterium]|nr:hypothetical protein [Solirubrobacterales bacterium]